jgi:hypothetical protein
MRADGRSRRLATQEGRSMAEDRSTATPAPHATTQERPPAGEGPEP